MKFRKNKKGFTIVELIIVIAVIGILTAVMVPTIVHLVGKANKASDEALVSNLNKAVQLRYSETGKKPETMHETVEGLKEYGYNVDALVAKSDESLLYNLEENKFVLEKSEGVLGHEENFWKVQDELGDQKYNVYAGRNFSMNPVTGLHTGFDAADKSISSITFESGADKTYLVRTNGGTFTVNSASSSIEHRGNVNELMITAVKKNASYHEYGVVAVKATLVSGSLDVMPDGYIKEVDTAGADAGSTLAVDGYVSKVVAAEGEGAIKATGNGYVADNAGEPMGTPAAINTSIASVNDLQAFKAKVNDGYDYSLLTVKLTANLDISSLAWEPIGNKNHPFVGTFDGQNHVISGLTNNGYEINATDIQPSTYSGNVGSSYGFFGVIGGASEKATIIKNLALDEVAIDIQHAKNLGGLFGSDSRAFEGEFTGGSISIENIIVKGEIKSTNSNGVTIGGIGGKVYNSGRTDVKNCKNFADLIAKDALTGDIKAAGIIGFISNPDNNNTNTFVFNGCKNYGSMDLKSQVEFDANAPTHGVYASGIVNKVWGMAYLKDCTTQGQFTLEAAAEIYFSAIARLQNDDVWVRGEEVFEEVTYKSYQGWNNVTVCGYNCSISEEEDMTEFGVKFVSDRYSATAEMRDYWGTALNRELGSDSFEGERVFYYFDSRPAMPFEPGQHAN